MPKINSIINPQNYELIRDRIAEIIVDEIEGQKALGNDIGLKVLYLENHIPVSHTNLPCIVISTSKGSYKNKTQKSIDGNYDFFIDVITKSKSTKTENGDKISAVYVQKVVGLIRTILESPVYNTLGFAKPFSCRSIISGIEFGTLKDVDEENVQLGRLTFNIDVPESMKFVEPVLIYEYVTSVKLGESNSGYLFSGQNPSPDDGPVCSPAILNINGVSFDEIASGGTLDLQVVNQSGALVGSKVGVNWVVNTGGNTEEESFQFSFIYE